MKNRPCPACRALGRDKTGDHLYLMRGGDRWACSKNGLYHPPYFEDPAGNEAIATAAELFPASGNVFTAQQQSSFQNTAWFKMPQPSLADIALLPSLAIRSIPQDVVEFYKVKCECNPVSGEIIKHYYPITSQRKVVSYKVREIPKTFYNLHRNDQLPDHLDMFGETTLNIKPRYCVITEGQLDAMAAFTMLAGMAGIKMLRVLSLPNGANTAALVKNATRLNQNQHLFFAPDMDDPGKKLIHEIWKIFPHMKIMEYSEKDASDMLDRGKQAEFHAAFTNAKKYKPSGILTAKALKAKAMQDPQMGLSTPFPTLTKLTYGIRRPSLIAVGAGPGVGKSTFSQKFIEHMIYAHKQKIGAFFFEERPEDSLRRLAGHIMRLPIHLPGVGYDKAKLAAVLESFEDLVTIYDHSGYRDWQDVEEAMRYMAGDGVKMFVLDPISALHTHLDAGASNQFLSNAMFKMSKMIHELDLCIMHINHLNNPMTGSKDHNEGAPVKASQFTGSRAQWRFSTDVWGLSRDSLNSDMALRNTTMVIVLKNRLSGQLGSFPIRYDPATGTLEEPPLSTAF